MKKVKKFLALSLSVLMIFTTLAIFSVSAETQTTKWLNNDGATVTITDAQQGLVNKTNSFFEYGGFRRGTGATGTVWQSGENVNTTSGRFTVPANASGTEMIGCIYDGYKYIANPAAIHGVKITAPYSGKILVTYQLQNGNATNMDLVVGSDDINIDSTGQRSGVIKEVSIDEKSLSSFDQYTMELTVAANTNYYFLIANMSEYKAAWFWINSVEYTSIDATAAESEGYSVTMGDSPVVNFYVDLTGNPSAVAAEVKIGDGASYALSEAEVITGDGLTDIGYTGTATALYKYSVAVPAKQMTETVSFVIKHSDGTVLVSDTYSVNEYCQAQIDAYENDSTNTTKREVALACTGILLYGRSAQTYFGYNTSNMPEINAELAKAVAGIS